MARTKYLPNRRRLRRCTRETLGLKLPTKLEHGHLLEELNAEPSLRLLGGANVMITS